MEVTGKLDKAPNFFNSLTALTPEFIKPPPMYTIGFFAFIIS